jgi:hypothetical protein
MLDLIATIVLTATLAVNFNAMIVAMPLSSIQKLTTVTITGLWIGFAIALGATGIYAPTSTPIPVVGLMVIVPLIVVGAMAAFSANVRQTLSALPLPLLIGLNTMRILTGAFMLLDAWQGRLSGPFPLSAGWGDILAGLIAIPLIAAAARDLSGNRGVVLAWNILGTLDLVTAVALGVLSAPGSPLQMFGGTIGSTAMWSLPQSTVPTLLVPFYLMVHGIIFARLFTGLAHIGERAPA